MKRFLNLLLAVIIVFATGYGGWKYWQTRQSKINTSGSNRYLVVKEWGVRMKKTEGLADINYSFDPGSPNRIVFLHYAITRDARGCGASEKAWGVTRYLPDDPSPAIADEQGSQSVRAKDSKYIPNAVILKVGENYYKREYPQMACANQNDALGEFDVHMRQMFESLEVIKN